MLPLVKSTAIAYLSRLDSSLPTRLLAGFLVRSTAFANCTTAIITIHSSTVHVLPVFPNSVARELLLRLQDDLIKLMQHCSLVVLRILVLLAAAIQTFT